MTRWIMDTELKVARMGSALRRNLTDAALHQTNLRHACYLLSGIPEADRARLDKETYRVECIRRAIKMGEQHASKATDRPTHYQGGRAQLGSALRAAGIENQCRADDWNALSAISEKPASSPGIYPSDAGIR